MGHTNSHQLKKTNCSWFLVTVVIQFSFMRNLFTRKRLQRDKVETVYSELRGFWKIIQDERIINVSKCLRSKWYLFTISSVWIFPSLFFFWQKNLLFFQQRKSFPILVKFKPQKNFFVVLSTGQPPAQQRPDNAPLVASPTATHVQYYM